MFKIRSCMALPGANKLEIHGKNQVNRVLDGRYGQHVYNRRKVRPVGSAKIHMSSRRRGENVTCAGEIRQLSHAFTRYSDCARAVPVNSPSLSPPSSAAAGSTGRYTRRIPVPGKHVPVRNTYQRIRRRLSHLRRQPSACRTGWRKKNYVDYHQKRIRRHGMKLEDTDNLSMDGREEAGEKYVTMIHLSGRQQKEPASQRYRDKQQALYGGYLSGQLHSDIRGNPVYYEFQGGDYPRKYHTLDYRQAKNGGIQMDMQNWRSPELVGNKSKSTPELTSSDQHDSGISSDSTLRDYQQAGKLSTSLIVKTSLPGDGHTMMRSNSHRPMGSKILSLSAENLLNLQRYQAHVDKRRCEHEIERLERKLTAIGARIRTNCDPYAIPPLRVGRFPSFLSDRRPNGSDMSCELGTESDDRDTGISNSSADDESSTQGKKENCFSVTAELEKFMRKTESIEPTTAWPGESALGIKSTDDIDHDPLYATISFNSQSNGNNTKQSSNIHRTNRDVNNIQNGITVKDFTSRTNDVPNHRTLIHTIGYTTDSPYMSISDVSQPQVQDLTLSRVPLAWQKSVSFSADTLDNENKTKRYQKEKIPVKMEHSAIFIEEDETSNGNTFFVRNGSITRVTSMTDDEKVSTCQVKQTSSQRANGHLIIQENGAVIQKMEHNPDREGRRTRKILLSTLVIIILLAIIAVAVSLGIYFGTKDN